MDTIISRLKADNTISYEATNYIKNTDYECYAFQILMWMIILRMCAV